MIQTYEAIYESGAIRLADNVRLPEHTKVYVVVPELESQRTVTIYSPRLAHPEQAVDFVLQVTDEDADAPL